MLADLILSLSTFFGRFPDFRCPVLLRPVLLRPVLLRPGPDGLAAVAAFALLLGLFVHNFWATTDLWLLARVADQFWSGNGLVWNPGERVWVYTSVAWQWCMILARGVTAGLVPPYLYVLVLHVVCVTTALALVWLRWRSGRMLLLTVLLFAGSNTLVDYTSGGLENSLGYAAVAAVWLVAVRGAPLRHVALAFGLALLVRHDLAILLAPAVALSFWQARDCVRLEFLRAGVLASGPVALWSVFAWVYYGSVVPNGYHGYSVAFFGELWPHYWRTFATWDLWGVGLLILGVGSAAVRGGAVARAFSAGCVLYCVYVSVVFAPQDVLVGRALTAPLFLSVLLLAGMMRDFWDRETWLRWSAAAGVAAFALLFAQSLPPFHTPLFPSYSTWSEPYSTSEVSFSWFLDARFVAQPLALPHVYRRDWAGLEAYDRERFASMHGEIYVDTVGAAWIVAYYLPLDAVVVEGFHRVFRNGDVGIDAP